MEKSRRHLARRLYDAEFDFNCFGGQPVSRYMLATLPRSGSTYCAIKLWQTGLLGAPMEYLNFWVITDLFKRLGYPLDRDSRISSRDVQSYWMNVQVLRTSLNGVFGWKMFTSNFLEISRIYPNLLQDITPNYILYLTRNDELGQAFSYSRAMKSKTWFGGIENATEVTYDFNHIKLCLKMIRDQKSYWEKIFLTVNVEPMRLYYEDLLANPDQFTEDILIWMGINLDPSSHINVPITVRQTDGVSKAWRDRFAEDIAHDTFKSGACMSFD